MELCIHSYCVLEGALMFSKATWLLYEIRIGTITKSKWTLLAHLWLNGRTLTATFTEAIVTHYILQLRFLIIYFTFNANARQHHKGKANQIMNSFNEEPTWYQNENHWHNDICELTLTEDAIDDKSKRQ